jgi:hypothetical protein
MVSEPAAPLDESTKAKANAAVRDLAQLINFKKTALFPSEGPPQRMCHYTDFAGLKGILESRQLWATYGRTLNDSTERQYGHEMMGKHLRGKIPPEAQQFVESQLDSPRRNFVSCFCQSSQVLSMWRAYASFGGGYCLEFDGRGLVGCKFPPYEFGVRLRMTYGNEMPQAPQEVLDAIGGFAGRGRFEAMFLDPCRRTRASDRDIRPASHLRFRAGHVNIKPHIELSPLCPTVPHVFRCKR